MEAHNNSIGLTENLSVIEQETLARAEEFLGGVPDWYLENKEHIEHEREESREKSEEFLAQVERVVARFHEQQ
jgi:hypothetical protein